MEIIEIRRTIDLNKPRVAETLSGGLYVDENQAHKFIISAVRNGESVALTGTVSGKCLIWATGQTVALTGSIVSGAAELTLAAGCYTSNSRVTITIFITVSSQTVALYQCHADVFTTGTDAVLDPGTILPSVSSLIAQIEAAVDSIPPTWTELSDEVDELNESVAADLYYHITDTDALYWRPEVRVNSAKKQYATSQTYYTGLYKEQSVYLSIYPGSKISAKTGYTLDYSILDGDGNSLQGERGVAAGTEVTLNYAGRLLLSVTDGTSDTSTGAGAKALAKAGLNIDLVVKPIKAQVDANTESIAMDFYEATLSNWYQGSFNVSSGEVANNDAKIRSGSSTTADLTGCLLLKAKTGYKFLVFSWDSNGGYLGYWRAGSFSKSSGSDGYYVTEIDPSIIYTAGASSIRITLLREDGSDILPAEGANLLAKFHLSEKVRELEERVVTPALEAKIDESWKKRDVRTDIVAAQRQIAEDWHFPFIDVGNYMGLGANHIVPGTKATWSVSGTSDLDQKGVWMSDGVHPFKGDGVTDMYGLTIAQQLALVSPSFHGNASVAQTAPYWTGKTFLWMGTSIPAGSDPDAGQGTGSTYPTLVAGYLGATTVNKSKGSSCVRVNASTGEYTGMMFSHFLRAMSRTVDEADAIAANWTTIQPKISSAPSELTETHVNTMKAHSFENLLVPYLDGTNAMPDLFVFDHGHNDRRPLGVDGKNDMWLEPTVENIAAGLLAEDTYMTANSYAKLKLALNDDLSGIDDLESFAASLNRNCFRGAMNFLITVILRYNPYARIAIIGDYN